MIEDSFRMPGHRVAPLDFDSGGALQGLMEACDDYARVTFGLPTGAADAQSQFLEGLQYVPEADKHLLGVWSGTALVAAIDFLSGYPTPAEGVVGMLLVHPGYRRRGLGTRLLRGAADHLAAQRGATRLRVDCHVAENTGGGAFLRATGLTELSREVIVVQSGERRTRVLWTTALPPARSGGHDES
ncbi:GNAT family N-acetyltransferase [Kitasatospora sp. NPDC094028]